MCIALWRIGAIGRIYMDHDVLDIRELPFHILLDTLGHLVGLAEGFISVYGYLKVNIHTITEHPRTQKVYAGNILLTGNML